VSQHNKNTKHNVRKRLLKEKRLKYLTKGQKSLVKGRLNFP